MPIPVSFTSNILSFNMILMLSPTSEYLMAFESKLSMSLWAAMVGMKTCVGSRDKSMSKCLESMSSLTYSTLCSTISAKQSNSEGSTFPSSL